MNEIENENGKEIENEIGNENVIEIERKKKNEKSGEIVKSETKEIVKETEEKGQSNSFFPTLSQTQHSENIRV